MRKTSTQGANGQRGFISIHDRHLDVHEDQINGQFTDHPQRFQTIFGSADPIAQLFQHDTGGLAVDRMVVNHQDMLPLAQRCVLVNGFGPLAPERQDQTMRSMQTIPDGIEQIAGRNGFGQHRTNFQGSGIFRTQKSPHGGHQNDLERGKALAGTQGARQLQAVHAGHGVIKDDQVIGARVFGIMVQQAQRSHGAVGRLVLDPPGIQVFAEDPAVDGDIIDNQGTMVLQRNRQFGFDFLRLIPGELHIEVKAGTLAHRTPDRDIPAHDPDQLMANGQPQPCAAVLAAGRTIDLRELFKNDRALVRRNANAGIFDRKLEVRLLLAEFQTLHIEQDMPLAGEFGGVEQQIGQNLAQTQIVGFDQAGCRRIVTHHQFQPLALGLYRNNTGQTVKLFFQIEDTWHQLQLARLNLGKVEDVVDHAQQTFRRRFGHLQEFPLFRIQAGVLEEVDHADCPV